MPTGDGIMRFQAMQVSSELLTMVDHLKAIF